MTPIATLPRTSRAAGACLVVALGVSGCHDSPTDPTASLVAEETHSALHLDASLPSLPDLAAREGVEDHVAEPVGQWVVSWERSEAEGRRLREDAYRAATPALADALGRPGVARAVEDVALALEATRDLTADAVPATMLDRLVRARAHHADARAALAAGDNAVALDAALRASDAFREVGPHSVALALVVRAEGALAGASLDEQVHERTERLVRGAREAIDEEDWSRAIQRAFYACQLLGVALE